MPADRPYHKAPCAIQEEIPWPTRMTVGTVINTIDCGIGTMELIISLRGTLKTCRGSIHWHVKKDGIPGTLEITVWPAQQRIWFSARRNRSAAWIPGAIEQLKSLLS